MVRMAVNNSLASSSVNSEEVSGAERGMKYYLANHERLCDMFWYFCSYIACACVHAWVCALGICDTYLYGNISIQ